MALHHPDYYADYRWCPSCRAYVHFLSALEESFCVQCGGRIRCFRSPGALDEAPGALDELPSAPDDGAPQGRGAPPVARPDPGLPHSA